MATIDILPLSINGVKPPLNLLFDLFSKGGITDQNLMYPIDLSSNPNFGHAIQFTVHESKYGITNSVNQLVGGTGSLSNVLNPTGLKLTEEKDIKATISLYMPDTLTSDYSQNFTEISLKDELGPLLNSIRGGTQMAGNIFDAAKGGSLDVGTAKKVWSSVSSDPNAIALLTSKLGQFLSPGSQLGNVLLQGQGFTYNPQLQMIYSGTNFRTFQLSFTFTPNSKQEAQMVNNIIYAFKFFSAPSLTNSPGTFSINTVGKRPIPETITGFVRQALITS